MRSHRDRTDVVVAGGGPGGTAAATLLARQGVRVTLVEKAAFPRFHIGESLNPYCLEFLDQLGALPRVCQAGFPEKLGAIIGLGRNRARFLFSNGETPVKFRHALQTDRSQFDSILLEHAEACGVRIIRGRAVGRLDSEPPEQSEVIEVVEQDGYRRFLECSVLIDATGRARWVAKGAGIHTNDRRIPSVAYYAHATGLAPDPFDGDSQRFFRAEIGEGCWYWFIPLGGDRVSIGVVVDDPHRRTPRRAPITVLRELWAKNEYCVRRAPELQLTTPAYCTTAMSYNARQYADGRALLVGDAAFFADPILSTGVYTAFLSAQSAANATLEVLGGSPTTAFAKHDAFMRRHYDCILDVVESLYLVLRSPSLTRLVLGAWRLSGGRVGVFGKYQDFSNGLYCRHETTLRRWHRVCAAVGRMLGAEPFDP